MEGVCPRPYGSEPRYTRANLLETDRSESPVLVLSAGLRGHLKASGRCEAEDDKSSRFHHN